MDAGVKVSGALGLQNTKVNRLEYYEIRDII